MLTFLQLHKQHTDFLNYFAGVCSWAGIEVEIQIEEERKTAKKSI